MDFFGTSVLSILGNLMQNRMISDVLGLGRDLGVLPISVSVSAEPRLTLLGRSLPKRIPQRFRKVPKGCKRFQNDPKIHKTPHNELWIENPMHLTSQCKLQLYFFRHAKNQLSFGRVFFERNAVNALLPT